MLQMQQRREEGKKGRSKEAHNVTDTVKKGRREEINNVTDAAKKGRREEAKKHTMLQIQ
jgi:hypothetical protein